MPRSSSPYLFEQLTGEIIFSHLTASICQVIILPQIHHQSRLFVNNDDTKLIFNCTKQILSIDQHPSRTFDRLEADLLFRFRFNESFRLNIPASLKKDLSILGDCQTPSYTEQEKHLDEILASLTNTAELIFPNQSPAVIDDDFQFCNKESSIVINHRYVIFESTLNVDKIKDKLLQLERLLAFLASRHILRLFRYSQSYSLEKFPGDIRRLIKHVRSNQLEKLSDTDIPTLQSITLSCVGFAGFSMPVNAQSDIVKILKESKVAQDDRCRYYLLNTMLDTGRLLFYHVDDTEKGWRQSILCSMMLLSERLTTMEILQKSSITDFNALLNKVNDQKDFIEKTNQSLSKIIENNRQLNNKMNNNTNEINRKFNNLENNFNNLAQKINTKFSGLEKKFNDRETNINRKIDEIQKSTTEQFTTIIQLITANTGKKQSRSCSCILF